jgi:hypothetical protein
MSRKNHLRIMAKYFENSSKSIFEIGSNKNPPKFTTKGDFYVYSWLNKTKFNRIIENSKDEVQSLMFNV